MPNHRSAIATLCALAVALIIPAAAPGARDFGYGFVEDQFADNLLTNTDPATSDLWWDRAAATNSGFMRINLYWAEVAGASPPAKPADPSDPSYDWSRADVAARGAAARGVEVVFTVLRAPTWAEGPNRDPEARAGSWDPDVEAFGKFAKAVAKRYSGSFGGLPRVRYYEAWNEPNLPIYISPQWEGRKPRSPEIYRELLNAFYTGIKSVSQNNEVIAGGTSPFGDPPGGKRMRPYFFWREVMCLKSRKKLKKAKGCAGGADRAHLDIYAHNPINAVKGQGPKSKSPHPDDGVPANFKDLTRIVRAAEKKKTILPQGKGRPGWGTETWYESKPPERKAVSMKTQARFMQEALYVLWKQKVETVIFLQLRDSPYDPSVPALVGFQTGVYLPDDTPKPSLQAVQFPFVGDRKSKRKVKIWGIAPKTGKVTIKDKKKKLKRVKAKQGKVFTTTVKLGKGKHKLRGSIGNRKSLFWTQK